MTHESEGTFQDRVVTDLIDLYGEEAVETSKRLDVSDRIVDIHVQTPDGADDLAIEVENDFESAFTGHGQATLYGHQLAARPLLVVPPGHIKLPEALYLTDGPVDLLQWPRD